MVMMFGGFRLLNLQTTTTAYWTEDFSITAADLDFIYNLFLEEAVPLTTPDLIQRLISARVDKEFKSFKKIQDKGEIFRPQESYDIGQEIIFPAFDFSKAEITDKRAGQNPEYGDFSVIEATFNDGTVREFGSDLTIEHQLNEMFVDMDDIQKPDPRAIYSRYKRTLTRKVVDALREDDDTLFIAKRWFLKSLLIGVNQGHLNLAEAILDMGEGGPLPTSELANVAEFGEGENQILKTVSLDYALLQDERFDEVGPAGKVLWFLQRMEPETILETPKPLRYHPIEYDAGLLTPELIQIEEELDDELSLYELVDEDDLEDTAVIRVTYPHLRAGTLPLTQRSEHIFPIAYRTPRILFTLVDGETQEEIPAWVVRESGYVYGLADFYERHQISIGALLRVRADEEDLSRVIIEIDNYRSRSEWVRIITKANDRIMFKEGQITVTTPFDELMIFGAESYDEIDALRDKYRGMNLGNLIGELIGELASFSPQQHVHAKTIYSAVNVLRRCPPAPIFAELRKNSRFNNTGGAYWRLS